MTTEGMHEHPLIVANRELAEALVNEILFDWRADAKQHVVRVLADALEARAAEAVAVEREACARVAEDWPHQTYAVAATIRARGSAQNAQNPRLASSTGARRDVSRTPEGEPVLERAEAATGLELANWIGLALEQIAYALMNSGGAMLRRPELAALAIENAQRYLADALGILCPRRP